MVKACLAFDYGFGISFRFFSSVNWLVLYGYMVHRMIRHHLYEEFSATYTKIGISI